MTCSNCKHSIPGQAYPRVYCWFNNMYMDNHDKCVRWVAK